MHKQRLFERIKNLDIDPNSRRSSTDKETEVESIVSHINMLLTSRRGSTLIADDYGISDISFHNEGYLGEYMSSLEKELEQTIGKYEKRLMNVKITFDGKDEKGLNFNFSIKADLRSSNSPITFETVVDSDGRVRIYDA